MLTFPLQCFLNDKNIFNINFTHSLTFQWKLLVMAKHGELFASKILVWVQPLITQLYPLHVHKYGFIKHNRFTTINRWSVVHYDISLQRTSLQGYIICFARYCCKEVSLERYLQEISRRLYGYLADSLYPWDVSLIIGNKSQEKRFFCRLSFALLLHSIVGCGFALTSYLYRLRYFFPFYTS